MRTIITAISLATIVGCSRPTIQREVRQATGELASAVEGHNAFAVDLYQESAQDGGNLAMSPFSISVALGMTAAGARGDTATSMADVLHIDPQNAEYHAEVGRLMADLDGDFNRPYTLSIANQLWGQADLGFEDEFLTVTSEDYAAPLAPVDFVSDPTGIRNDINDWVASETDDEIPELLSEGFVTSDTRLVLVNAIYFQADWAHSFDPNDTTDADFHTPSGTVQVPTMDQTASLATATYRDVTVLEMPYESEEVSFFVVLPPEGGMQDLESSLTTEQLGEWMDGVEPGEVHVRMPRFEVTYELPLKETLQTLGMEDAFQPGADFTGIADAGLYLQGAVHKAVIKVDEEGTTAAAATGVGAGVTSAPIVTDVIIDRPFLYAIRDNLTGSLLFMGRVEDPS